MATYQDMQNELNQINSKIEREESIRRHHGLGGYGGQLHDRNDLQERKNDLLGKIRYQKKEEEEIKRLEDKKKKDISFVTRNNYPTMLYGLKGLHDISEGIEGLFNKFLVDAKYLYADKKVGWFKVVIDHEKETALKMDHKIQKHFFKGCVAPCLTFIIDEQNGKIAKLGEMKVKLENNEKKLTALKSEYQDYEIIHESIRIEVSDLGKTIIDSNKIRDGYIILKEEIISEVGAFSKIAESWDKAEAAKILKAEIEMNLGISARLTIDSKVYNEMLKHTATVMVEYSIPDIVAKQSKYLTS